MFVSMFCDLFREEIVTYTQKLAEIITLFDNETISNKFKPIAIHFFLGTD